MLTCLCSTCYVQGLGKAVMYCGDGIDDLAALAVADMGMAISSSNAAAAASVCDRRGSVAAASISAHSVNRFWIVGLSCQLLPGIGS